MFRFFVVGLGGSGGKTIQFLMERLRNEIKKVGWTGEKLPQCWQFLHIDTPTASDGIDPDLPSTVGSKDGRYFGFVSGGDKYGPVDAALAHKLRDANQTELLYRWRPQIDKQIPSTLDLTRGASQFRTIGRVASLTKASGIYHNIDDQVSLLNTSTANEDLNTLVKLFGADPPKSPKDTQTMVFIISSLSGGTGSSIVLDVANLLRSAEKKHSAWFGGGSLATAILYTSELFSDQGVDVGGVEANSVAAMAEIVNALSAASVSYTDAQWCIYGANIPKPDGRGPNLVFPVGAYSSVSRGKFGDGKPLTIFRGVASAIASMMLSQPLANEYSSYAIGNGPAALSGMEDRTGWTNPAPGSAHGHVGFSGMGMASVDLGRDRFREYVSQRIAAETLIDLLLEGHKTPAVKADPKLEDSVLRDISNQAYPAFLVSTGFPAYSMDNIGSVAGYIWSTDRVRAEVTNSVTSQVFDSLQYGQGSALAQQIRTLPPAANPFVKNPQDPMKRSLVEFYHRQAAENWLGTVQTNVESAVLSIVSQFGLQVAINCAQFFATDLDRWVSSLRAMAQQRTASEVAEVSVKKLQEIGNGQVGPQHVEVGNAKKAFSSGLMTAIRTSGAELNADLIAGLKTCVVEPLLTGLTQARDEILRERNTRTTSINTIETNNPSEWPRSDADSIARFDSSKNEYLLAKVGTYPEIMNNYLSEAKKIIENPNLASLSPLRLAGFQALVAPKGTDKDPKPVDTDETLGRDRQWRPKGLGGIEVVSLYKPFGSGGSDQWKCSAWVLDRARTWVERPNTALRSYCDQGLETHLLEAAANNPEAITDFLLNFQNALGDAGPLVKLNNQAARTIHNEDVAVMYKFSYIPGGEVWEILKTPLIDKLASIGEMTPTQASDILTKAARSNDKVQRIDVIGLFAKPYSPLVFSSLTEPICANWGGCTSEGSRRNFWTARRSRCLPEFIPASPSWLKSFLIGWVIGRLTGEVRFIENGSRISVLVEPSQNEWMDFKDFVGVTNEEIEQIVRKKSLDAIPMLLESLPLAWAQASANITTPWLCLAPYMAIKELGDTVNHTPYSWAESKALRAYFDGTPRSGDQPDEATEELRKAAVKKKVEALKGSFDTMVHDDITERDFWLKPRHWELRHQLLDAVTLLLKYLNDDESTDDISL